MQRLISELQRRKVLRVASAYVVAGWIILQVALALQTAMNLPAWFSTVIVSLLIIGLPIALVATWFLEITPEGIKRTTASGDGALVKPQTTDLILAAMLALVLVVALVQAVTLREGVPTITVEVPKPEPPALGDKSIAVLPFANLSPDKDDAFFADGLTEEVLNVLAQVRGLRLISRTSSFAFKGKDTPLPEIAKQLGVRHILEGSVRRDGEDIRITSQLIDVTSDTHLWSETFERKAENVFAVQDQIARAIANALDVEIAISASPRSAATTSMEAYRLFLEARELFRLRRTLEDLSGSVALYKRAIELDPGFAEAYSGLAVSYSAIIVTNSAEHDRLTPLSRAAAETAIKLKPSLAQPHAVLGGLARFQFDWEIARAHTSKALSLDPSDLLSLYTHGLLQLSTGHIEEASRIMAQARQVDPLYAYLQVGALQAAFARGDDSACFDLANKLVRSGAVYGRSGHFYLVYHARLQGNPEEAEKHYRAWAKLSGAKPLAQVVAALRSPSALPAAVKAMNEAREKTPALSPTLLLMIGTQDEFLDALNSEILGSNRIFVLGPISYAWRTVATDGANLKVQNAHARRAPRRLLEKARLARSVPGEGRGRFRMQLSALTLALGRFVSELQRRKVIRVGAGYVVGAWIVLQVALALQTAMTLSATFSAAILALLVIGFPIALVLTWFFEITPDGIKRTSPATGDGELLKPQTTDLILAGALTLVIVVAVAQLLLPNANAPALPATATTTTAAKEPKREPPRLGDKSIAVLPFANLSIDPQDAVFADGLTEEVLNALAQVRGVKVISRTSSSAFHGKNTPLPQIAKVLGVRYILEGSVRRDGEDARVVAQLIDVPTDTHVWSKTFEPKLEHVFAVQDDIARAIASALDVEIKLAADPRGAPTKNLEAYRLFLQAIETSRRGERGYVSDLIDTLKRATSLDPNFAGAQAVLAVVYTATGVVDPSARKTALPLAKQAVAAALKAGPNLPMTYAALAAIAHYELRWADAVEEFSKAIELDPSLARGHIVLGPTLARVGKFKEAARVLKEGQTLDPLNPDFGVVMLLMALDQGNDRVVEAAAQRLVGSSRDIAVWGNFQLAKLAQDRGDHSKAEKEFRAFMAARGTNEDITEPIVGALRSRGSVVAAITALRTEAAKDPTFEIAEFLFLIDPKNTWIDEINARIASGETLSVAWRIGEVWRLVAQGEGSNPKLKALMRNAGFDDYWKKHGWPDRCRAKGEDDFECS